MAPYNRNVSYDKTLQLNVFGLQVAHHALVILRGSFRNIPTKMDNPKEVLNISKHTKIEIEKRVKIEIEHIQIKKIRLNQAPFYKCLWTG